MVMFRAFFCYMLMRKANQRLVLCSWSHSYAPSQLFGHIRYLTETLGRNPGMRLLLITVLIKCPFVIRIKSA